MYSTHSNHRHSEFAAVLSCLAFTALLIASAGTVVPRSAYAGTAHTGAVATIGVSVPMGELKGISVGIVHGVEVAVAQANQAGIVGGVAFRVLVKDDAVGGAYSPAQDVAIAKAFIADPTVIGEVGPANSSAAMASEPVDNAAGLTQITPSCSSPKLTDPSLRATYEPRTAAGLGPLTFFRTVPTDAFQGPTDAYYAVHVLHAARIFIVDNTGAYGVGLAQAFRSEALRLGATVAGYAQLDLRKPKLNTDAIARSIAHAAGGKVDLVFFGGEWAASTGGGTVLADALKAAGVNAMFMGGDGIDESGFITSSVNGGVQGAYASNLGPDPISFSGAASFRASELQQFPGSQIGPFDVEAYDAANILLASYAEAVTTHFVTVGDPMTMNTRSAIARFVGVTKDFKAASGGAAGSITFDANGDPTSHTFSIYKVSGVGTHAAWQFIGIPPLPTRGTELAPRAPVLIMQNQPLTVVGGRMSSCGAVKNLKGRLPGCMLVSVGWLPGAALAFTVRYPGGTTLTFTGTTDSQGLAHFLFNVAYRPPLSARHGQPSTVAYVSATGVKGTLHAGPVSLRFGVIAQ